MSVGEYRHRLEIIAVQEQKRHRAASEGSNYWPGADVCCGYLVVLHVGSGYLD